MLCGREALDSTPLLSVYWFVSLREGGVYLCGFCMQIEAYARRQCSCTSACGDRWEVTLVSCFFCRMRLSATKSVFFLLDWRQ